MSALVKDAIAEELATLERLVDPPVPPFGYGSDIRGTQDLDPSMRETDGRSTLALAEALVRRLDCPRGALPDAPDYGLDLRGYLHRGVTADQVRALGGQVRGELLKDDRVASLVVTVRPSADGRLLRLELAVSAIDPAVGDFALTLSASSAEVLLEEIRSA